MYFIFLFPLAGARNGSGTTGQRGPGDGPDGNSGHGGLPITPQSLQHDLLVIPSLRPGAFLLTSLLPGSLETTDGVTTYPGIFV